MKHLPLLCLALPGALFPARLAASAETEKQPAPAAHAPVEAVQHTTLAEKTLRDIAARQAELFAKAEKEGEGFDGPRFQAEAQAIAGSYDVLIQKNPEYAAAYAAYGVFLGRVGMDKQAVAILIQANKLDGNLAIVKNQIGKHLCEDGHPVDALPWFTAAVDLEPNEPLYHYQLGTLLHEARDDFLTNGNFTREAIDKATLGAFARAAELSPGDPALAYRHAKAFFELDPPRYADALPVLEKLEARSTSQPMKQLARLRRAEALFRLGKADEARALLDGVTDMQLVQEKQTLLDQFAEKADK